MEDEQLYASNNFCIYRHDKPHYNNRLMGGVRHYINYVTKGNCRYVTPNRTIEVKEGDFFYTPMGMPYESYTWGDKGFELHSCGFVLFPEARERRFKMQKLPQRFVEDFLKIPMDKLPNSATLATLYSLLDKLLPYMEEEDEKMALLLERFSDQILRNPSARIPVLAHKCNMAESTLYVHIKELSGKTPNEYRMDVLLGEAIRLLASTDIPVQIIAERLGFSSANYFRQVLKKHTSLTPSKLRNRPRLKKYG